MPSKASAPSPSKPPTAPFDRPTAGQSGRASGDFVRLSVRDDGCGMDPDIAGQIFEPFFTTKQLGVGTGLGLATVYGTVEQNNGFIAVRTARDEGTTFEIYLPRYSATQAEVAVEESSTASPVGRETVLVVEDEPAILFLVTHVLTSQGCHVLRANSPQAAIDMAAAHPGGIGLLLTDVIMPEMNGRATWPAALQQTHPGMRALFMSGYTSGRDREAWRARGWCLVPPEAVLHRHPGGKGLRSSTRRRDPCAGLRRAEPLRPAERDE